MYRTLCVVVAVMLICATGKASVATRKMELASAPVAKAEPSKMIAVDGLHVIVPNDVMVLPVDLLPQP